MWHMPWQPHWDRRYQVRKQCIEVVAACNAAVLGSHNIPNFTVSTLASAGSALRQTASPTGRATKPLAPSLGGLQQLLKSSVWEMSSQELLHRPNLIGGKHQKGGEGTGKGMRKKAAKLKDPTGAACSTESSMAT